MIKGRRGSGGEVCLNGAAARLGSRGDLIIICSYSLYDENELLNYRPAIVHVGEGNRIFQKVEKEIS